MAMTKMEWIAIARQGARDPNVQMASTGNQDRIDKGASTTGEMPIPRSVDDVNVAERRLFFVIDRYNSLFQTQGASKPNETIAWSLTFTITGVGLGTSSGGPFAVSEDGECLPVPMNVPKEQGMLRVKLKSSKGVEFKGTCPIAQGDKPQIFIGITPTTEDTSETRGRQTTDNLNGPTRSMTGESTAEIGADTVIAKGSLGSKLGETRTDPNRTTSVQDSTSLQSVRKILTGITCKVSAEAPTYHSERSGGQPAYA